MRKQLMPMVAIACYVLAFNTNRPNYDIIEQNKPATPILVAKSYNDELNFKEEHKQKEFNFNNFKLTEKQINSIVTDVQKKEKEEQLKQIQYQKDLYLIANLVDAECGSSWLCDEQQMLTVCVLQNRIKSNLFPNTLHNVIYQRNPKQYESAWNGSLNKNPSNRALKNVKTVLDGKFKCPDKVMYQCEHVEGKIYKQFYNKYSGTTTYFCYSNK